MIGCGGGGRGEWKVTPARIPKTHATIAIAKLRHMGDTA